MTDTVLAKLHVQTVSTTTFLILAAWILQLASWFLPTVKPQDFQAVAGWQAFRLAACAIWPCGEVQFHTPYHAVLATVSVTTILVFVLCSPCVVLRGTQSLRRWSAWVAAAAFVFNMHWIVTFGPNRSQLAVGYFVWLLSFFVLAIGLFVPPRIVLRQRAV